MKEDILSLRNVVTNLKDIYQMREFAEAKLVLAKDYIAKALKLIEEIKNG